MTTSRTPSQLINLKATLKVFVHTYNLLMTSSVTNPNLISRSTNLDWQLGYDVSDSTLYSIVNLMKSSEIFWMHQENIESSNAYLSLWTFTGYTSMQTDNMGFKGITYCTDTVRAIATSIYGIPSSVQGLSHIYSAFSAQV